MRDAYFDILGLFNQLLTVTQSCKTDKEVNPEAVRSHGIRLMQAIKHSFPWANLTPTVHQMAAHNWELFTYRYLKVCCDVISVLLFIKRRIKY